MTDADARTLGQRGGRANTPLQQLTRRLNAYRTLADRYPTSIKARQHIARLQREIEHLEKGSQS